MSWLNSPKKLTKLIFILLISTCFLLVLLVNSTSYYSTDTKADDQNVVHYSNHVKLNGLNTTWDNEYNPWILQNSNSKSFLEKLTTYSTQGHTADLLYKDQQNLQGELTIVLPISKKESIVSLNQITSWTLPIPFKILIICPSNLKSDIESINFNHPFDITVQEPSTEADNFISGTAGASTWLNQLKDEINTDYVYLSDENISKIDLKEISYLLTVSQLNLDYQQSFIGTKALVLSLNSDIENNYCLPVHKQLPNDVSQPADMLLGGWLLQKSWLSHIAKDTSMDLLQLPLGYYISLNLKQQLNIPTVYLPSTYTNTQRNKQLCEQAHNEWIQIKSWKSYIEMNRIPTALHYRYLAQQQQQNVMVVVDGSKQFMSFYPLLCRFKKYPVHLVLLGQDLDGNTLRHALEETNCYQNIQIHDFSFYFDQQDDTFVLEQLIRNIQPKILFQIADTSFVYHIMKTIAASLDITEIALPEKEIVHALWIPDLSLQALSNWNKVEIKLVVITDRRPHSLSRLLQSASTAIYVGNKADIVIHMEQSADRVTRMLVNSFMWQHGQKIVRHRIRKGGLMPAIVESWYPSHNDEYAVLLEDDIEVSPLFYVWSKYAILKYRYSGNKESQRLMYGISLYAPRNLELVPSGRVTFDPNDVLLPAGYAPHTPYASQIPCSWGGVYFPEHWREFHSYLVRRLEDLNLPKDNQVRVISVPNSRSDKWKKSWKKYFIELVYLRAYVMLYPNFEDFEAFSTNHVEVGTHFKTDGKRKSVIGTFMVPLMQRDTILSQLPNQSLPLFEDLPVLDLWGQLQSYDKLESVASEYHKHVSNCPRKFGTFDPKEFFCVVNGPPDPLQEFPMSPKQPPPPVLIKDAVQRIQYHTVHEYTKEEKEHGMGDMLSYGPKPLDVARLPMVEERFSNNDDELLDFDNDLDTLNRLYLKLHPENLNYLETEKQDMQQDFDNDIF